MRRWGYAIPLLLPLLFVRHLEQSGVWTWMPVALDARLAARRERQA